MATHDYIISNASGAAVRADLNNALAAIATNNSSATEPTTTYAYQWWADTGSTPTVMKLRNAANSGWVTLFQLDGEWSLIPFENGTAAAPSIYFKDSGTDTGFYSPGVDQVGITTGGAVRLTTSTTAVTSTLPVVHPLGAVGTPSVTFTGDLNTGIYSPGADSVAITTNGTQRATVDSSGRLLVGTTTSRIADSVTPALQIEGTSFDTSSLHLAENTNDAQSSYLTFVKSRGTSVGSNTVVQNNDNIGQIRFAGTDGTKPVTGASIRASIDGTPGTDDMPTRLTFHTVSDGTNAQTERMRITSAGFFKATNGTYYGGTAGNSHDFSSDITNSAVLNVNSNTTSFTSEVMNLSATRNTSNSTYNFLVCVRQGAAFALYIRDSGNVVNVNNSYGAISDIKLKENIVDANSQWDDLKALQVRNYNFKEETGNSTHTQIGLIAQEVEQVSPGLVSESPDRDEEGNDLGTVTKGVNYSVLYMKAVKALQEAMERIETLEAKVAALEAN